ncbi:MAG: S1 RNA-binding domain-containing protein [Bradymonadaceae bacterium]
MTAKQNDDKDPKAIPPRHRSAEDRQKLDDDKAARAKTREESSRVEAPPAPSFSGESEKPAEKKVEAKAVEPTPEKPAPVSEEPVPEEPAPTREKAPAPKQDEGFHFADTSATMDDFAAMFEAQEENVPERRNFDLGDIVEGEVISIGPRYVFVDLGGRNEGVAELDHYRNEEGEVELEVGQTAKFYVVSFKGGIQLGKEMTSAAGGIEAIQTAFESGLPVKGRVTGTNKGGFEVEVQNVPAFCPISQIDTAFTEDPMVHVDQTYLFRVTEVREGGRTIVLSRAALLREEQEAAQKETLEGLQVGDRLTGTVTRIADFGAFVDIGGIDGLVHVSELSHIFFDRPSDIVKEGDEVQVVVLKIEEQAGDKGLRIGLSMKAAEEDPWLTANEKFAIGQKVTGTIVRLASFGAFVEISPGLEGLVHVSEMSWERHVATPSSVVSVGEEVNVEIQDIDILRKRISLSMKGSENDPWRNIEERFVLGMEVTGKVENVEDFGAFIDLGKGITALLPRSEMGLERETTTQRKYSPGLEVTARILSVEPTRRRIALTLKAADEIPTTEGAAKKERPATSYDDTDSKGSFGTLGDLFKDKKLKG